MTWLTGPAVLLLMNLCLLFAEEKDNVEVIYPQKTIMATKGSSVKLSCQADYDSQGCGVVHVVWYKTGPKPFELNDPEKYFSTVNETVSDDNRRRRQVVTEILRVTSDDEGQYQCKAECEKGEQAMGHFIRIFVKG